MPTLEYKHSPVAIGATGAGAIEEARGIVRGLASTYGNTDLVGDVVDAGAFTDSLRTDGARRVILWQHKQEEPIGMGTFTDTPRGLEVAVELDKSIRRAAEALTLSKMGALAFSIGYTVKRKRGTSPRHLEAVDLAEVSFVTFPANPQARITSAKEAAEEAEAKRQLVALVADVRSYRLALELSELNRRMRADLRQLRRAA